MYSYFEKGRDALRQTIKKFAFSKNSMFDGNGNITYLKKYANDYPDEIYEDDFDVLDINRINYVLDSLHEAFSGKELDFEMESEYCSDWMIAIKSKAGEISFCGDEDGPINGYDPDIRTNIFSMKEDKHYYLYINDRFGQVDCTSELYIDLQKAELN